MYITQDIERLGVPACSEFKMKKGLNDPMWAWSVEKHGCHGGRLFALYRHEEILKKKSSSLKPLVLFGNNFTGLFLGWPFSKIVCEILIHLKTWPPWGRETCCTRRQGSAQISNPLGQMAHWVWKRWAISENMGPLWNSHIWRQWFISI